ncbi:hypothetical protein DSO57_1009386 [Entomophthora muscae]|uniref:Uncharacterized protein n=1 Tax=Entomophthora muscae TaxID=34485 RepID=A0ACC2SJM0_9FUNG|nr:hypothetical protein DSO57_1009386 [Entomophthora muscae]
MVLTTGAASPLVIPFATTFSGLNNGKLQLGELNSGIDSEGCGDSLDPQAVHPCFSWLAGERAAFLATNLKEQAGLLEALNQYGVTPVIVDRPSEKGFAAQHNGPKSKENSDNCLETQAARSCYPQSCSGPKATPKDAQLMEQSLTWLMAPEDLLVHDDKNSGGNKKP